MNEAELLNAEIDRELNARIEAELQAKRARERADIAARMRHQEAMAHLDKVNRRHPIEGPGDPKLEAARVRAMDERVRAYNQKLDAINSRVVEGSLAHRRSLIPGSEGFAIKGVGQR